MDYTDFEYVSYNSLCNLHIRLLRETALSINFFCCLQIPLSLCNHKSPFSVSLSG